MTNHQGSAEITDLLVGAGVELNRLNKFRRSAMAESVLSDNIGAMEVLVNAGAKTEDSLRLARARGKDKIVEFLGQKTTGEGIPTIVGIKAAIIRKLEERKGEEVYTKKKVEAKKKEKKKLLDKAKTSLRTEPEKMEKKLAMLESKSVELTAELARYKKEEEKKIKTLTWKLNDLRQDLDRKLVGRVKSEDVGKCLECPVCLDLCKPPREVSPSPGIQT